MALNIQLTSDSEAATAALAQSLAPLLQAGDVLALTGDLGAGKTTFTRSLVTALGVPATQITSPTFVLIHEYAGQTPRGEPVTIQHCDVYRLTAPQQFLDLGVEDWLGQEGIALIEWADRVAPVLPASRLDIALAHTGLTQRTLTLSAVTGRGLELLQQWQAQRTNTE